MSNSRSAIIVSPRVLLREGIASLLQNTHYKVVASVASPAELSAGCPKGQRTLAIVGFDRQSGNLDEAVECIRLLRSLITVAKVVLVLETDQPTDLQPTLALCSDGCIFNLRSRDTLIKVLELASSDQRVLVFATPIAATAKNDGKLMDLAGNLPIGDFSQFGKCGRGLSSREKEILTYLSQGKSNKAIARLCKISEATVKVHLKTILRKTNTQNRTQAAVWAIEHGPRDHPLGFNGSVVADAPTLPPAGATGRLEYRNGSGGIDASRDEGLPPEPPSARHPGPDRPHGR